MREFKVWLALAFAVLALFAVQKAGLAAPSVLQLGDRNEAVLVLQELLAAQGYFAAVPDGNYGPLTEEAVRAFQTSHGLKVDGVAGPATWEALNALPYVIQSGDTFFALAQRFRTTVTALAEANPGVDAENLQIGMKLKLPPLYPRAASAPSRGGARAVLPGSLVPWEEAKHAFRDGATAEVTDVETGLSFTVRRRGGHFHADIEPLTARDTQVLRQLYGKWSWERRAVVVDYGAGPVAASINGMPHGGENLSGNNFPGHICLHFLGSKTHGSASVDPQHQAMVRKAAGQER